MTLVEGGLAVVKKTGYYEDVDSGEKDILYAKDVVRLSFKMGSSWLVDPGPGANTMKIPGRFLAGFKDPGDAERKYKPGDTWGVRRNPGAAWHRGMLEEIRRSGLRTEWDRGFAGAHAGSATKAQELGMPNPRGRVNRNPEKTFRVHALVTIVDYYGYPADEARKHIVRVEAKTSRGAASKVKKLLTRNRFPRTMVEVTGVELLDGNPFMESLVAGLGLGTGFLGVKMATKGISKVRGE